MYQIWLVMSNILRKKYPKTYIFYLEWVVPELPQALHFDLHDLFVRLDLVYINRHKHTFLPARFVHLLSCRSEPEQ